MAKKSNSLLIVVLKHVKKTKSQIAFLFSNNYRTFADLIVVSTIRIEHLLIN